MPSLFLNFNKCSYTIQSVDIPIIIEALIGGAAAGSASTAVMMPVQSAGNS